MTLSKAEALRRGTLTKPKVELILVGLYCKGCCSYSVRYYRDYKDIVRHECGQRVERKHRKNHDGWDSRPKVANLVIK